MSEILKKCIEETWTLITLNLITSAESGIAESAMAVTTVNKKPCRQRVHQYQCLLYKT